MSDSKSQDNAVATEEDGATEQEQEQQRPKEYGGPKGKEPTRYGDWEKKGRCIDF